MAMALHQLDETLFAKLAKFVFRLSNAVTISDKNVAGSSVTVPSSYSEIIEQADDRAAAVQRRTLPSAQSTKGGS